MSRKVQFSNLFDLQAPWIVVEKRPPPDWPALGEISLVDYSTRYRKELGLVLDTLNCDFKAGERVRICKKKLYSLVSVCGSTCK